MSRRLRRLHRRHLVKKRPMSFTAPIEEEKPSEEKRRNPVAEFYDTRYKTLLIIPFAILFLSLAFLGYQFATTGSFIGVGVSISGGLSVTATGDISYELADIDAFLQSNYPNSDISTRWLSSSGERQGLIIEISGTTAEEFLPEIRSYLGEELDYSVEETGSTLGSTFFRQMMIALALAFVLMGIVVFFSFRNLIPSLAVILSAASDMIITLAVISMLNVKLSLAGIAAFLMLIGYSVDANILLTTRVLKRKQGTVFEKIVSALETGITMNITTLVAISIALIFSQSPVLQQIMLILFVGLLVDMLNTWVQNVGILRLYLDRKKVE